MSNYDYFVGGLSQRHDSELKHIIITNYSLLITN